MTVERLSRAAAALVLACAPLGAALAQYPEKPIRFIVPVAPGGTVDIVARTLADPMSKSMGQPIVVENRPSASSLVGTQAVAKSAPDGYTLLAVASGFSISPAIYSKLPYDAQKDLAPISLVVQAPFLLLTHPSLPAGSTKELIALARAKPGALAFGSAGQGSSTHLAFALFTTLARIDILHVPYKGTGPALVDAMAGQVHMLMGNVLSSLQYAKAGKLRAHAVTTKGRSPAVPDIPTLEESGVAGYESSTWHGWFAPGGTPALIVEKLNAELARAAKAADVVARLAPDGAAPIGSSPEALREFVIADIERWKTVVKSANIKLE
jgi:tripartite-type tricarboxylate transporter receptor subunit TctC